MKNPGNFPKKHEIFQKIPLKNLKIFAGASRGDKGGGGGVRLRRTGGFSKIFDDRGFWSNPPLHISPVSVWNNLQALLIRKIISETIFSFRFLQNLSSCLFLTSKLVCNSLRKKHCFSCINKRIFTLGTFKYLEKGIDKN